MKIVIECDSSSDESSFGCDYALLDLTPDTARHLLEWYKQFMKFREETGAYEVYWFDSQVEFFSPWGSVYGANEEQRPSPKESEGVAAVLETCDEWIEVPDAFVVPDCMQARTECDMVVAREEGILFFCYPKHTSVNITTRIIPPDLLRRVTETEGQ